MTIYVNNKALQTSAADVAALALEIGLPAMAAVAVNNRVVPRAEWGAQKLCEGDKLTVIRVTCGG